MQTKGHVQKKDAGKEVNFKNKIYNNYLLEKRLEKRCLKKK